MRLSTIALAEALGMTSMNCSPRGCARCSRRRRRGRRPAGPRAAPVTTTGALEICVAAADAGAMCWRRRARRSRPAGPAPARRRTAGPVPRNVAVDMGMLGVVADGREAVAGVGAATGAGAGAVRGAVAGARPRPDAYSPQSAWLNDATSPSFGWLVNSARTSSCSAEHVLDETVQRFLRADLDEYPRAGVVEGLQALDELDRLRRSAGRGSRASSRCPTVG